MTWHRPDVIRAYTQPEDVRQRRLIEIRHEIKALQVEAAQLKESLLMGGVCEVCGKDFQRVRVTKRVCSQKCALAKSQRRTTSRFDLDLIATNLPLLEASGQLKPHVLELVKAVVRGQSASSAADDARLSRERVGQYLNRATGLCKMLIAIRDSISKSIPPVEVA